MTESPVRYDVEPRLLNRAVGAHDTPTSDAAWDGPANNTRARSGEDAAYYRRIYAWQDPDGEVGAKSTWKFIHHQVAADGTPGAANLVACSTGIGVLNGGRGGTVIPDADRQGVWSHLASHLRAGDREPPPLAEVDAHRWQARRRPRGESWYRIQNAAAVDTAELWIYDEIGPWFAVTARDFVRDLHEIKASTIKLRLHSPGGEIFDSIAIYRALLDHPARVEVSVDALAASSASIIAMAGDRITMARHARMMIHDPWGAVIGGAQDMRDVASQLDGLGDEIASIYAERAGGSLREWRDRMAAETWYTDQEAVDIRLADEVGAPATRALNHFDLSVFAHAPADLTPPPVDDHAYREPTIRDAERALREAGCSSGAAKAILARGWDAREVPRSEGGPLSPLVVPAAPPLSPFRVQLDADLLEVAVR